ncbi:MAG: SurA N-terminal domain-containing protein [Dokdonella sp.]
MLSKLRESMTGLVGKIMFALILFAFSFFGIESYMVSQVQSGVAKVGSTEITQDKFRQRFDEYRQQVMQQMGDQADASFFQRPELKRQVLDGLVDETVLAQATDELGLVIPNQTVFDSIAAIPAFQKDGKFDSAQYRALLSSQGMSPASLEGRVREDLAARTLPLAIGTTAFVTDSELDTYLSLRDQLRDFRYVKLDAPAAPAADTISDADIEAFYEANKAEFRRPEQVSIEYLDLQGNQLDVDLTPDDAVLRERYEKEKSRYVSAEQRQASHILIKVDDKAGPDAQKAALAKAEAIRTQLTNGKDFAELAKEDSDDLGSKAQGGDLGWLDQGLTEPAFDEALFKLAAQGDVSEPVLTAEGYHIIRLAGLRPGKTRSFDEVKSELSSQYLDSERERVFNDAAARLTDLTYEDPSSLERAANDLKLTVQKTPLFGRNGGGDPLSSNPQIAKAAFSDSVLVQGNNSDPIPLSPERTVVLRKLEHQPATDKPLAEVRDDVRQRLISERTVAAAKADANALLARLNAGESLQAVAAERTVEDAKGMGREAANVDGGIVSQAFSMMAPAEGKVTYATVPLADQTYVLIALDKVIPADASKVEAETRKAARTQLSQDFGGAAARDLVAALRKGQDIKINEDRLQE